MRSSAEVHPQTGDARVNSSVAQPMHPRHMSHLKEDHAATEQSGHQHLGPVTMTVLQPDMQRLVGTSRVKVLLTEAPFNEPPSAAINNTLKLSRQARKSNTRFLQRGDSVGRCEGPDISYRAHGTAGSCHQAPPRSLVAPSEGKRRSSQTGWIYRRASVLTIYSHLRLQLQENLPHGFFYRRVKMV